MAAAIAWVLNLDADSELRAPEHYRRTPELEARIAALRARLSLLKRDDRVIGVDRDLAGCARALAFCPTPSALSRTSEGGFTPPPAPPLDVLRRVNGRRFCAELGQTLPHAHFVESMAELEATLAAAPAGTTWLLKRPYAFAGRERRRAFGAVLDEPTRGFARRSFARGEGLQVEPLLARTADFALHGYVLRDGRVVLGRATSQRCDARGAWVASRAAEPGELSAVEHAALVASAREAGEALAMAGYFGPFGVDAFRYSDPQGGEAFQPRSEINARFSMGYPRELLDRALELEGEPSR